MSGILKDNEGRSSGLIKAASSGGGGISWQTDSIKTATFTAEAGKGYFCNTNGGAFTLTLPASPTAGDQVGIKDYGGDFNSNNLTIGRNGSNLDGNADDKVLTANFQSLTLVYVDSTQGWEPIESGDLSVGFTGICATGGTEIICGASKIHVFTGSGTFSVNSLSPSPTANKIEYMVVAGGGGSGSPPNNAGGGGAGGFQESDGTTAGCYTTSPLGKACGAITATVTGFPITIGAGGATSNCARGTNGSNSSFSTVTSAGGGGGAYPGVTTGKDGGSGGGGSSSHNPPASGGSGNVPPTTPPQGQPGGNKPPASYPHGGGGATQAGPSTPGNFAPGGDGAGTAITLSTSYGAPGPSPSLRYYAGGGGVGGNGVGRGNNCYPYTGGGGANSAGLGGIVILRYRIK